MSEEMTISEEKAILKEEKEILEEERNMLEVLTKKIDELTKTMNEQKIRTEEKIREHPLSYVTGAFLGGLVAGFIIGKGRE